MSTLILGIGNSLLSDDGAGIHAIHYLSTNHSEHPDVNYLDGGTLGFSLATSIAECDALIVIDAAELESEAGSVKLFEGEEMDAFLGTGRKSSVHEVGLWELLATSRMLGELPQRRAFIGIQPESISWGEMPSDPVDRAIPSACTLALEIAERWR